MLRIEQGREDRKVMRKMIGRLQRHEISLTTVDVHRR